MSEYLDKIKEKIESDLQANINLYGDNRGKELGRFLNAIKMTVSPVAYIASGEYLPTAFGVAKKVESLTGREFWHSGAVSCVPYVWELRSDPSDSQELLRYILTLMSMPPTETKPIGILDR